MENEEIYKKAVEKWGFPLQFGMLMEECAELIKSTNKYMRKSNDQTLLDLAEEMADVEIMIEQLKTTVPNKISNHSFSEIVEDKKHDKLFRLREMLDNCLEKDKA